MKNKQVKRLMILSLSIVLFSFVGCNKKKNNNSSSSEEAISSFESEVSISSSESEVAISSSESEEAISSKSSLDSGAPSDKLYVIFNEMHKQYADGILIKYKDFEILVDAGETDDSIYCQQTLRNYCTDGILDLAIFTHPHSDHIGGINANFFTGAGITKVNTWIDNGATYSSGAYRTYENVRTTYINNGTTYLPAYDIIHDDSISTKFYLSEEENIYIEIFNTTQYPQPNTAYSGNLNNSSVVFGLNDYKTQFYFGGDFTTNFEKDLINNIPEDFYKEENFTVYKASHHGSSGANSYTILRALKPDMCLVSAAITQANRTSSGVVSNQHPHEAAILRMSTFTDKIYWNGTMGTFICTSDGTSCEVKGEGRTINYYFDKAIVDPQLEKDLSYLETKWYLSKK